MSPTLPRALSSTPLSARAEREYQALSPTPDQYKTFLEQIHKMWETQPNWTAEDLRAIADHEEAIKRENTEFMAANIPGAGLLLQSEVSHFSFIQDPEQFNRDVLLRRLSVCIWPRLMIIVAAVREKVVVPITSTVREILWPLRGHHQVYVFDLRC